MATKMENFEILGVKKQKLGDEIYGRFTVDLQLNDG